MMATPQRPLRTITILNFIPAFPLCIAHGVLSNKPFPAVGLVGLFLSAVFGILILPNPCNPRHQHQAQEYDHDHGGSDQGLLTPDLEEQASGSGSGSDDGAVSVAETPGESSALLGDQRTRRRQHRAKRNRSCTSDETGFLVFLLDLALAVALMVILVFTWVHTATGAKDPEFNGALGMLAAYATIPLLVNFFIHLYLAIREFIAGLALHGFIQYAAWQALPPDCPRCGERLRPEATPEIPWLDSISMPSFPRIALPSMSMSRPTLPVFSRPKLSLPGWLKRRTADEQPLFVDDAHAERDRYTDDEHDDGLERVPQHGEPSSTAAVVATGASDSVALPVVEEVVVGKKDKKKRTSSSATAVYGEEEEAPWS